MQLTYSQNHFIVFDTVLSPTHLKGLRDEIASSSWKAVHSDYWQRVWRIRREAAWEGQRSWGISAPENPEGLDFLGTPGLPNSVRAVYEAILHANAEAWRVVGKPSIDWKAIDACPYLYTTDSGLPWHTDDGLYSGAFIFYAHEEWNVSWGGELLISSLYHEIPHLGPNSERRGLFVGLMDGDLSLGHFLLPVPNRLVLLKAGYPHAIQPVEGSAGERNRETISGFFLRPKKS